MSDERVGNELLEAHFGEIVRSVKAASSRAIRQAGVKDFGWQANYHEHVIRNEADLDRIRRYVTENPLRWELDREHPRHRGTAG